MYLRVTRRGFRVGRPRAPVVRYTGFGSASALVNAVTRWGGVWASKRACHTGRFGPRAAVPNHPSSSALPSRWT